MLGSDKCFKRDFVDARGMRHRLVALIIAFPLVGEIDGPACIDDTVGHVANIARRQFGTILGASPREGEAIFAWLQVAGVTKPRACRLPWSRDLTQQPPECDGTKPWNANRRAYAAIN